MRAIAAGLALAAVMMVAPAARADDDGSEPKLAIGGSLAVWIPQSDADDFADISLGIRPQATYWIRSFVGITASFDYVFVNEDGAGDVTYFAISAGGRLQWPRGKIRPYGEFVLGFHSLDADGFDDTGVGFRLGGGASYLLGSRLVASAGLGYSTVSLDAGFVDVSISAFILDFGIAARF